MTSVSLQPMDALLPHEPIDQSSYGSLDAGTGGVGLAPAVSKPQSVCTALFELIVSGFPAQWGAADLSAFVEDMSPPGCKVINAYAVPSQEGSSEMVLRYGKEDKVIKVKKALKSVKVGGCKLATRLGESVADDLDGCSVFIEGLDKSSTSQSLRTMFSPIDDVESAYVLYDSTTGESRCSAKVRFRTREKANEAVQNFHGSTLTQCSVLSVRIFKERDAEQSNAEFIDDVKFPHLGQLQKTKLKLSNDESFPDALYVGNLTASLSPIALAEFFGNLGPVSFCNIFVDPDTGRTNGDAKVIFEEQRVSALAIERFNGVVLGGKPITVRGWRGSQPVDKGLKMWNDREVFVGGLNPQTTREALAYHFSCVGTVVQSHIFFDKATMKSKGSGKVTFDSVSSVPIAIEQLHGSSLDGFTMGVKKFGPKQEQMSRYERYEEHTEACARSVFVGCLSEVTTEETLYQYFEALVGDVAKVQVFKDKVTGQPKCAGRVEFLHEETVQVMMEYDKQHSLDDKIINVTPFVRGGDIVADQEDKDKKQAAKEKEREDRKKEAWARSIFVGMIKDSTTEEALWKYFDELVGGVVKVHLFKHKETGESKRAGRVEFLHEGTVQVAIDKPDKPLLDGQSLKIGPFKPIGLDPTADQDVAFGDEQGEIRKWIVHIDEIPMFSRPKFNPHPACKEVFIEGLPPDGKQLVDYLACFGEVKNMYRIPHQSTTVKEPTDKGYVCFCNHEDALKCVQEGGATWSESERFIIGRNGVEGLPDAVGLLIGAGGKAIMKCQEMSGVKTLKIGPNLLRLNRMNPDKQVPLNESKRVHWIAEGTLEQFAALVGELEILLRLIHEGSTKDDDDESKPECLKEPGGRKSMRRMMKEDKDGKNIARCTDPPTKIFVGGIPQAADWRKFNDTFEKFGEIIETFLPCDKDTHKHRGFGFVTFAHLESVEAALSKADTITVDGKWVEIRRCQPKAELHAEKAAPKTWTPAPGQKPAPLDYSGPPPRLNPNAKSTPLPENSEYPGPPPPEFLDTACKAPSPLPPGSLDAAYPGPLPPGPLDSASLGPLPFLSPDPSDAAYPRRPPAPDAAHLGHGLYQPPRPSSQSPSPWELPPRPPPPSAWDGPPRPSFHSQSPWGPPPPGPRPPLMAKDEMRDDGRDSWRPPPPGPRPALLAKQEMREDDHTQHRRETGLDPIQPRGSIRLSKLTHSIRPSTQGSGIRPSVAIRPTRRQEATEDVKREAGVKSEAKEERGREAKRKRNRANRPRKHRRKEAKAAVKREGLPGGPLMFPSTPPWKSGEDRDDDQKTICAGSVTLTPAKVSLSRSAVHGSRGSSEEDEDDEEDEDANDEHNFFDFDSDLTRQRRKRQEGGTKKEGETDGQPRESPTGKRRR
eukprot:gnl/MRDRNA2_/MRDRNA2_77994_c0_seq2.p1 gnl/MRDRNA2_/MRDRNA2_77994_c0~~gnl/MRDRNA2_/MRDRNA2_77994_c0_seq2.p1  ORF type:complete len:1380 (-),score=277.82 gnl/MRDRNA2_/MRDRNA2_77994_c0_seq2:11-4150(-)